MNKVKTYVFDYRDGTIFDFKNQKYFSFKSNYGWVSKDANNPVHIPCIVNSLGRLFYSYYNNWMEFSDQRMGTYSLMIKANNKSGVFYIIIPFNKILFYSKRINKYLNLKLIKGGVCIINHHELKVSNAYYTRKVIKYGGCKDNDTRGVSEFFESMSELIPLAF